MINKVDVWYKGSQIKIIRMTCNNCGKHEYLAEDPYCITGFEKSLDGEDFCPDCVQEELARLWKAYSSEED